MDKRFFRPLLIVLVAALLVLFVAPLLPEWDNSFLPLKRMDIITSLTGGDGVNVDSLAMEVAEKVATVEELIPLDAFSTKLQNLKHNKSGKLRIAYFGDSIIEGDLVTGTLRHDLQREYGGRGVGLVGITSIVNEFRKTIGHSFSRNWESVSFMSKSGNDLGIMGHTYIPRSWQMVETTVKPEPVKADTSAADSTITHTPEAPQKVTVRQNVSGPAWVEYRGANHPGGMPNFEHIRLFYSHAAAGSEVRVSYDGTELQRFALTSGESLQMLNLSPQSPISRIRLEFDSHHPIRVYGVSFDAHSGVYVDNISIRGYSGMYFSRIPLDILQGFHRHLKYDLVILQYGENVTSPKNTNYDFYQKGMVKSVEHIKKAMPGVPILIISAHDRSIRTAEGLKTSPDIPILIKAQSDMAKETGSAFWNLFAEMGGLNSMPDWVNASPPLAAKDYTHFSIAGAKKVGEMLLDVIKKGSLKGEKE
ncbi:MAG: hypothetical protein GX122_00570 [Candidatus Cloacimonetes bacterium]|nr:hypothetical protein [Candidatus Cloacimonadota bacterium]NLO10915.1 hypothetical protein [Candidatus Cloacimonadota bacterium]